MTVKSQKPGSPVEMEGTRSKGGSALRKPRNRGDHVGVRYVSRKGVPRWVPASAATVPVDG